MTLYSYIAPYKCIITMWTLLVKYNVTVASGSKNQVRHVSSGIHKVRISGVNGSSSENGAIIRHIVKHTKVC